MTKPTPDGDPGSTDPQTTGATTVRQVAELARLSLDAGEARALADQFARILEQFRVLERLDVADVEPTTGAAQLVDVARADVPRPCLAPDAVLAGAPARADDFYSVPKTVGGDS